MSLRRHARCGGRYGTTFDHYRTACIRVDKQANIIQTAVSYVRVLTNSKLFNIYIHCRARSVVRDSKGWVLGIDYGVLLITPVALLYLPVTYYTSSSLLPEKCSNITEALLL